VTAVAGMLRDHGLSDNFFRRLGC